MVTDLHGNPSLAAKRPTRTLARGAVLPLSRASAAVIVVTALLAGCTTHGPVPAVNDPSGRCTPENSLSVYCP